MDPQNHPWKLEQLEERNAAPNLPYEPSTAILIAKGLVALAITLLIFFAVFSGVRALFG
jgi:hypothetical protein